MSSINSLVLIIYEVVDENKCVVLGRHYKPFDEKYGVPQEMIDEGILVEKASIPKEPAYVKGKEAILYINPQTKEMWYEYVDKPLTPEEVQQEVNEKIDLLLQMQMSMQGVI